MLIQFAVTVDGRVVGTESCEVWGAAAEVEVQIRLMKRRTGRMALEPALLQIVDQTPAPCCGQRRMQISGRRVITGRTTFGEIPLSRRVSRCDDCGRSCTPADAAIC